MKQWKTLSRKTVLPWNEFLTVESHDIQLPDGSVIERWPWVVTPDFVNVMAITSEQHFVMFEQVKYGFSGISLAPVGGYIEAGEAPLSAAKRELLEETGFQADRWTPLGTFRVDPCRGAGMGHFFLAENACQVAAPDADDLEEQRLVYLDLHELDNALDTQRIKALAWSTIVLLALRELQQRNVKSTQVAP
jgi:ADP-ribose pyrophosphatase